MTKNIKTPIEGDEAISILCKLIKENSEKQPEQTVKNIQKSESYRELVSFINKHYCERYSFGPGKRNHLISINCL